MLPNAVLSSTAIGAPFLPPRNTVRFSAQAGTNDNHPGPIAIGDPSQGIDYQLWHAACDGTDIYLSAPNTPQFVFLHGVGAVWVALAFDQNGRVFLAWVDAANHAHYYWFNTLISGYQTDTLSGTITRIFAALDDIRPLESGSADVILAYVRTGELFFRAQRDRYGIEYDLGAAPSALVQVGMNLVYRFQFAFQNVQGNNSVPPAEFYHGTTS